MADPFDDAINQRFSIMESGSSNFDLSVDETGMTVYSPQQAEMLMGVAERDGPQPFAGAEDQENPFAIAGPVEDMSPGQFIEDVAETGAGAIGGAAAVSAGALGDLVGLAEGMWSAVTSEEGERLEAFLTKLSRRSQQFGSEKFLNEFETFVESLDLDEETKKNFMAGSQYLGEWAQIPGGIKAISAIMKGARDLRKASEGADMVEAAQ